MEERRDSYRDGAGQGHYAGSSASSPTNLTNVNGTLYFKANDGVNGIELWKSDGTAAGTVMVKDIYAGASSSSPTNLTNVNGQLIFSADNGVNGTELWKSDGTEAGTTLWLDIDPGAAGSFSRISRYSTRCSFYVQQIVTMG